MVLRHDIVSSSSGNDNLISSLSFNKNLMDKYETEPIESDVYSHDLEPEVLQERSDEAREEMGEDSVRKENE